MEKELNSQETRESIMRKRDIEFENMDESDYKNITDEWMDEFCGFVDITPPKEEKTFKTEITSDEEMDRFVGFVDEESELEDSSTPNGFEDEDSVVENEKKEDKSVESLSDEEFEALVARFENESYANKLSRLKKQEENCTMQIEDIFSYQVHKDGLFPLDVFPDWMREMVVATSKHRATGVDFVAGCALGVASALVCGKARIRILEDWEEPLLLWVLGCAETGDRKSAVIKTIAAPIYSHNEYLIDESNRLEEKKQKEIDSVEEKIKNLKMKTKLDDEDKKNIIKLEKRLKDIKNLEIKDKTFIVADSSVEASIDQMSHNGGRLVVLDTEATQLSILLGRYSKDKSPNYEGFLKGYTEDLIPKRRSNKKTSYIKNPSITMLVTSQPSVVKDIFSKDNVEASGFLPRFIVFINKSMVGFRIFEKKGIDRNIIEAYNEKCLRIVKRDVPSRDIIELSPEAKEYFLYIQQHILEPRRRPDSEFSNIRFFLSRYESHFARIIGLLHILNNCDQEYWRMPVEKSSVEKAFRVMENFVIPNIINFYNYIGTTDTPVFEKINKIVSWFKNNNLKSGDVVLSEKVRVSVRRSFKNTEDYKNTLLKMDDYNVIKVTLGPNKKSIKEIKLLTDPEKMIKK